MAILSIPTLVNAPFGAALAELGRREDRLVVLSADLSKYTDVLPFAEAFPGRFIQVGMAEQNMMGVAGGLAKRGLIPVAVTYGVFATRRACEQIQMALGTGSAGRTAVVVAFLPGISTPFRATHQATDDLSIMRGVPGMTVIDPVDATEMAAAIGAAVRVPGPVYLRGLRGAVNRWLDPDAYEFEIGRAALLREGTDIGLIGTGLGTEWALEAAGRLPSAAVLHVPTVKPLDWAAVLEFGRRYPVIATVENHSTIGGLGSAVAEVFAESGGCGRLRRFGIPDVWGQAGPIEYVRGQFGLDPAGLADQLARLRAESAAGRAFDQVPTLEGSS